MLQLMLQGWKSRKLGVILIMLGFIVEIGAISIGIATGVDQYQALKDKYAGLPNQQTVISFEGSFANQTFLNEVSALGDVWLSDTIQFQYKDGVCMRKKVEEVDLSESDALFQKNTNGIKGENNAGTISVLPIKMGKKGWKLPMMEGVYWTGHQNEDRHSIILGKSIAKVLDLHTGDELVFEEKKYKVIGIAGRKNRSLTTDDSIFMTFDDIYEEWGYDILENKGYQLIVKNNVSETDIQSVLSQNAGEPEIKYHVESLSKQLDYSAFRNTVLVVGISIGLILCIVIINMINVIKLWLQERTKEFTVMLAVGATKRMLGSLIRYEVIIIAILSAIVTYMMELTLKIITDMFAINIGIVININLVTILLSALFALICADLSIRCVMKTLNGWNPFKE